MQRIVSLNYEFHVKDNKTSNINVSEIFFCSDQFSESLKNLKIRRQHGFAIN